jgi:N-hydroxyarylamine O-acetyltransferase
MTLDLQAYARRIDYPGGLEPTLETLKNLHLAHATHIPFENLDILLGQPIHLDLENLWAKLVAGGRGGYCFEQNALFAAVLETTGFRVTRLAARVRMGAAQVRARSHMLLAVDLDGQTWLADVGFGAEVFLHPIPLTRGAVTPQFGWKYRVIDEGSQQVLQSLRPEGWFDLYSFTLEEQHPVDYEVSNYFTSTNPNSPFVKTLLVQRPDPDCRQMLVNRRLIEYRPDATSETTVPDDDALLEVLAERFTLRFPPGTRFPYQDSTPPTEPRAPASGPP